MTSGRAHWFEPDELDPDQRHYYDSLVNSRLSRDPDGHSLSHLMDEYGRLYGPHNVRLLDPAIGAATEKLAHALRYEIRLPPRCVEICVLETARHERANFEWPGHARRARSLGFTEADIAAIRDGADAVETFTDDERLVRTVARALLTERDLPDHLFAETERALGPAAIFDIVSVVGHYQHTALSLRVWRTPLRPGEAPAFPE